MHGARPSAIDINVIGTKGCYFELEAVLDNEDHPKMRANRIRAWKNFLHSFRLGVGGDIEVFRSFAADDVAHAASGEIRNMAALAQTFGNFARGHFHRRSTFVGSFHYFTSSTVAAVSDRGISIKTANQAVRSPYDVSV